MNQEDKLMHLEEAEEALDEIEKSLEYMETYIKNS